MKISPDVFCRTVGAEEVLLDMKSGDYFGLNEAGTFIWQGLKTGIAQSEIVDGLVKEFDVSAEQAVLDVQDLVAQLTASGLLSHEEI